MKYKKCCRNCEHAYLESCKSCSTSGNNSYENFELRKELAKIESGKLVELPAPLGSELWTIAYPTHKRGKETVTVLSAERATVEKHKYPLSLSNADMVGKYYFTTKEAAEAKLAEMRGGK